jgi:hypothetical protein
LLCSSGWLWTCYPPTSAFQVLGFQAFVTRPDQRIFLKNILFSCHCYFTLTVDVCWSFTDYMWITICQMKLFCSS